MKLYSFWRSLATFRVRIALNLKGIDYEQIDVDLNAGQQLRPEYAAINPQMVLPALIEPGRPVLFQSMAILEYLDERFPSPPLLPKDLEARARVRGLAQISVADAHPLITPRVRAYLERELGVEEPARMQWIRHWLGSGLGAVEGHLAANGAGGRFCHGDAVTLADICLVSNAVGFKVFGGDLAPYRTVAGVVEQCLAIDAFARAHPLRQPGAPKPA